MHREADYTIKGFLYQFNKTLFEVFENSSNSNILVEGIVEDIDVQMPTGAKAIQCKYHETKDKFNLSDISKPVLQFLVHFSKNNLQNIQYILYAFFGGEPMGVKELTKDDINNILNTKNREFVVKYISKLKQPIESQMQELLNKTKLTQEDKTQIIEYYNSANPSLIINVDDFLKKDKFSFEIGESYENLIAKNKTKLTEELNNKDDVEDIFYPNAIQKIAELSVKHDENERLINKKILLDSLARTKKTAITRWTRELLTYKSLLKRRREQLKVNLQINIRQRNFIIKDSCVENFDSEIVNFIIDFINKYNCKPKLHSETPIFCFDSTKTGLVAEIEERLYSKGIEVQTGYRGNRFFQDAFMKEPQRLVKNNWVEFKLRLCNYNEETVSALNSKKCDDLFIVSDIDYSNIDKKDLNDEFLQVNNFQELKFLLSINKSID
jgi:hypothetical protein